MVSDVGLKQGCVMSPWLYKAYVDGVLRVVKARVLVEGWNYCMQMLEGLR